MNFIVVTYSWLMVEKVLMRMKKMLKLLIHKTRSRTHTQWEWLGFCSVRLHARAKSFKTSDTIIQITELMHAKRKQNQRRIVRIVYFRIMVKNELWFPLNIVWLRSLWTTYQHFCMKHTQNLGNAEESEFLAKKLTYFSGFVLPFYEALPFCAICLCKNPADLELQRSGDDGKSTE